MVFAMFDELGSRGHIMPVWRIANPCVYHASSLAAALITIYIRTVGRVIERCYLV